MWLWPVVLLVLFTRLTMPYLCSGNCTRVFDTPTGLSNHRNACLGFKASDVAMLEKRRRLVQHKLRKHREKPKEASSVRVLYFFHVCFSVSIFIGDRLRLHLDHQFWKFVNYQFGDPPETISTIMHSHLNHLRYRHLPPLLQLGDPNEHIGFRRGTLISLLKALRPSHPSKS
jgi:hypothetical protein